MARVSNCRNFKCGSNKSGKCSEDHIELVPVGGVVNHLICIQAKEREESTRPVPIDPPRSGSESHDVA